MCSSLFVGWVSTLVKKKSCKISYDVPEIAWFSDPPVTKGLKVPLQEAYNHEKNDEPIKAFLACSQSDCADPKYKLLLESEPLV